MRKRWIIAICLYVSMFCNYAFCMFEDRPGARAIGLGYAYTSVSEDVYASVWNPSGLGQLKETEIGAMYDYSYLGIEGGGIGYNFVSVAQPVPVAGTFAVSWSMLNVDLYSEHTFIVSYGRNIEELTRIPVYVGVNLKGYLTDYIRNDMTNNDPFFKDNGFNRFNAGGDIGVMATPVTGLNIGLNVSDLNSPNMALGKDNEEKIPLTANFGVSYRFYFIPATFSFFSSEDKLESSKKVARSGQAVMLKMMPTADVAFRNRTVNGKNDLRVGAGLETWFLQDFSLGVRLGYYGKTTFSVHQLCFGATYKIKQVVIDYAFSYPLQSMTKMFGNHRISLTYSMELIKIEKKKAK